MIGRKQDCAEKLRLVTEDGQARVVACSDIPAETYMIQYTGEVVSNINFQKRVGTYGGEPTYCLPFTSHCRQSLVIDATVKGSIGR